MSRFSNPSTNTREKYVRVDGTFKQIIDLDAKVEIDLTKDDDDDDDEVTFVGWKTSGSSIINSNRWKEGERRHAEKKVMKSNHRQNEAGVKPMGHEGQSSKMFEGRGASRPIFNANTSIRENSSVEEGPRSTIRPEINGLGTKRQRIEPVSQRNGRHVKRKAGWSPLNPYSSVKREFSEDLLTSSFQMDCDAENAAGPSQSAATSDMDCDGDNIPYDQRRGQVKIEPGYTSQLVTQKSWSRVGNSSQGPSLFPKSEVESSELKLWSKSNASIHFQVGEEQREDIGSDDDYEAIHSGLDIHDESRWLLPPKNHARVENTGANKDLNETGVNPGETRIFRTSRTGNLMKPRNHGFIWDLMADLRQQPPSLRRYPPSRSIRGTDFGRIKSEKAMRVKESFKVAPGAINRIEQHDGWLAIASSCVGGQADEPDEEHNPYNRSGSLLTWNGQYHILEKHFQENSYGKKHYTINDVKYSNSGHCFLSAGMDKKVCVWPRPEGARPYSGSYNLDVYDEGVPFEVVFQPGNGEANVVAIGVQDIHVYANIEPNARKHKTVLNLVPNDHPTKHNAGVIRWDDINPHMLYASSEPQENLFDGVHKSFDVTKGKAKLTYNVNEAGDAMAINQVLALATRQESKNYLRIFDPFHKDCVQKVALETFSGNVPSREVSCMAFSPDGIYLALARMDNSVHVYDSRMLSKGVMQKYQHEKPRFITKENHLCGVTHAQWVTKHSGQYALLSGGEDGCVRLWNPMWSSKEPSNGQKITEAHSDVGYFSVGDPFKNEHDLVIGDSSGEVTIYTGLLNHL
ncbi:hypothetical protein Agabi119p4_6351 [Agaricus bisporus var. burnettii]|uniref:Uncharacterized protein n=2 Tax=Agaricus bisporus TaxID=5341 RepID=A0A8H7EZK7_AGABI|nr:hypothetical protein Agabi119p4_6351 [Agaricus bisporus var. burnettii]